MSLERLFVALGPSDEAREALASWCAARRDRLPTARWVPREQLHLTLRFVGDVETAARPALEAALGEVFTGYAPFAARLGEIGRFPPRGPARIVWVGFEALGEGAADRLAALQRAVGRAVDRAVPSAAEHPAARRRFAPHVTLARCREPWPAAAMDGLTSAPPFARPTFPVAAATLFRSELRPDGARHEAVARFTLGAAP